MLREMDTESLRCAERHERDKCVFFTLVLDIIMCPVSVANFALATSVVEVWET